MVGFKVLDKCIGLVSIFVLARLLTPIDFGLVAMALSVVGLVELMGAFGFDTALIQFKDAQRKHYDTAWTFNVVFASAIAALLLAISQIASDFYREARLEAMLQVLAFGSIIAGFENIGTIAFRKELDFRKEFFFMLAKRIATVSVTIPLAFALRSFWALIAGIVTGKVVSVLISYWLHPYRPRFSLEAHADLMHFSKWLIASNLVQFLHRRSTDFVLGRVAGSNDLGIFRVADELAAMPQAELTAPINRAVYPAYVQLSSDMPKLRERFLEVYAVTCTIAFPVAIGLFCVAKELVAVFLGAKWSEAVPIIQILGLVGLTSALQGNLYLVLLALGRPKVNTLIQASVFVVSLPTVIVASISYGLIGAAYATLLSAIVGFGCIVVVFVTVTGVLPGHLMASALRPFIASIVMTLVVMAMAAALSENWPSITASARLALLVPIGALAYIGSILGLWIAAGRPIGAESHSISVGRRLIAATARKLG